MPRRRGVWTPLDSGFVLLSVLVCTIRPVIGSTRKGALCGMATAALVGILVAAPSAHAQAAVDQYVPAPEPRGTSSVPPPAGETGAPASIPESASTGKKAEVVVKPASDGSDDGIELPISDGYPVTPFVVIVALLLAAALVARLIVTWNRRRESSA